MTQDLSGIRIQSKKHLTHSQQTQIKFLIAFGIPETNGDLLRYRIEQTGVGEYKGMAAHRKSADKKWKTAAFTAQDLQEC